MSNSTEQAIKLAAEGIARLKTEMTGLNTVILQGATNLNSMLTSDKSSFKELNELILKVNNSTAKLNENSKKKIAVDSQIKVKQNELAKSFQSLQKQREKEGQQVTKLNKARLIEADAIERNKKALQNQKKAVIELSRPFNQLIAKHKLAKKVLQDLTVSQGKNTRATKKAQKEYDRLNEKVNLANKATSNFSKTGLGGMARGFRNLLGAFGVIGGIQLFAQFAKQGFDLARKLDSLNFTMKAVIGNAEILRRTQLFLAETAEKYGASILTLTERYNKFYTAARQSGVTLKDTEAIFKSFTKSAGFLGLRSHELEGVFLALEQMLSKGKVTTEELRRQLGERLPGAFGVMAQTVQKLNPDIEVTVATLDKMLRAGSILSAEVLPEFAKQYEKSIGIEQKDAVETLNASIERMSNSWVKFVGDLTNSEGSISKVLMFTIGLVGGLVDGLNLLNETQEDFNSSLENKAFVSQGKYFDGLGEKASNYAKITKENAEKRIKQITKEIEFNNNLLKLFKTDYPAYYKLSREHNKSTTQANKENKKLNNRLATQNGILKAANIYATESNENKEDAINKDRTMAVVLAEKQKLQDSLNKSTKEEAQGILNKINILDQELKAWTRLKRLKVESFDLEANGIDLSEKKLSAYQKTLLKWTDTMKNAESVPKLEPLTDREQSKLDAYNKSLTESLVRLDEFEQYKDIFKGVMGTFGDEFDIDVSKFDFIFDSLGDKTDDLFDTDKIGQWADLSKELIGSVLDASLQSYDIELQTAQRNRDLILENDLATSEQKEAARKKFDEKERDINNRKAKQERKNSLIKIGIDTSVAVVKTFAEMGFVAGLPFAALMAGVGIAQAAIVASQPLPQFEKGTGNAPKGMAITDEKGAEIHTDKKGNIKDLGSNKGARQKYLEKGDKIFTADQSKNMLEGFDENNLQQAIFEMNMFGNGNILNDNVVDKALLNKMDALASSNEMVWREVKKLASRPISINNKVEIKNERAY